MCAGGSLRACGVGFGQSARGADQGFQVRRQIRRDLGQIDKRGGVDVFDPTNAVTAILFKTHKTHDRVLSKVKAVILTGPSLQRSRPGAKVAYSGSHIYSHGRDSGWGYL